ncbi:short-chain dehydrogenase [Pedobacter sp. MR2016-19]|uniref:short-chain dehydrogenase n=1 Tax=Pedobacter sp. MR2016-19 TaxID=2780089 RepID=UPI0018760A81|nr:short-chain dehydrogenase [Pedobacter sp. MR2016-19]MBE5321886.1 short-chain dehydrogenase [Pedobacter sp. MR2016-19]
MKNLVLFCTVLFLAACSGEKTDQLLLELDKKKLAENINYDKITFYKFAKIAVRSTAVQDTTQPEYQKFSKQAQSVVRTLNKVNGHGNENISVIDALRLYKEYRSVKQFVKETDEDVFPLLTAGLIAMNNGARTPVPFFKDFNKAYYQNIEHAILSMAVLTTRDLGQPFALYECAKTQPELLDDSEIKTLLEFVRGFLFFGNNLFYLSEDGLSRNIKWLDKNEKIPLPYTKSFFSWGRLSDEQTHVAFHSMNYLFRGFDRMRMERKIDEERSLEDFEAFLNDMNKLGIQNELVWGITAYLNLKKEKPEQSLPALEKLSKSPLFSNSEREALQQTIVYVKDRKSDKALTNVFDKAFIGKIATKYMIALLSKIDWEKLMKQQGVPYTEEVFAGIGKFKALSNSVSEYTQPSTIEKGKKEIGKKGSELLEKAKGLWN